MNARPTEPDFWETRYRSDRTPWDAAGVPPALARYLAARPGAGTHVLIPGCGAGHEIAAFYAAGYTVTAIDFSGAAVERARRRAPAEARIIEGDFFKFAFGDERFDVVYERTFLCALPPDRWAAIAQRTANLLKPDGALVGIFFYGPKDDGPPFGLAEGEAERVFVDYSLDVDQPIPASESLPIFAGDERWQERRPRRR